MGKLRPCPFCGGEAELIAWHEYTEARHVVCKKCGCMTGKPHFMRSFAIEDWNTRSTASLADEEFTGVVKGTFFKYFVDDRGIDFGRGGVLIDEEADVHGFSEDLAKAIANYIKGETVD